MPSTVIRYYSYNETRRRLTVTFNSGLVYEYDDVPPEVYEEMRRYREKGVFLNQRIKGRYAYRKIESS